MDVYSIVGKYTRSCEDKPHKVIERGYFITEDAWPSRNDLFSQNAEDPKIPEGLLERLTRAAHVVLFQRREVNFNWTYQQLPQTDEVAKLVTALPNFLNRAYLGGLCLEKLDLSAKLYNIFERERIQTVKDVLKMRQASLLSIRRFGAVCLREIRYKLNKMGLDIRE